MVLLGILSSCSPAELVYGQLLCISEEFLQPRTSRLPEHAIPFLSQLQKTMRSIRPPGPRLHGK